MSPCLAEVRVISHGFSALATLSFSLSTKAGGSGGRGISFRSCLADAVSCEEPVTTHASQGMKRSYDAMQAGQQS